MNKAVLAVILGVALGSSPTLAQEKKAMPMKEGMQMKGGMMEGGMMEKMMEMQGQMGEMQKGMGGMMKGKGMMKSEDMKGMGNMMGKMSGTMGDMRQMMGSGKMTPEEMKNMSKMMGDMSGMMKAGLYKLCIRMVLQKGILIRKQNPFLMLLPAGLFQVRYDEMYMFLKTCRKIFRDRF